MLTAFKPLPSQVRFGMWQSFGDKKIWRSSEKKDSLDNFTSQEDIFLASVNLSQKPLSPKERAKKLLESGPALWQYSAYKAHLQENEKAIPEGQFTKLRTDEYKRRLKEILDQNCSVLQLNYQGQKWTDLINKEKLRKSLNAVSVTINHVDDAILTRWVNKWLRNEAM